MANLIYHINVGPSYLILYADGDNYDRVANLKDCACFQPLSSVNRRKVCHVYSIYVMYNMIFLNFA